MKKILMEVWVPEGLDTQDIIDAVEERVAEDQCALVHADDNKEDYNFGILIERLMDQYYEDFRLAIKHSENESMTLEEYLDEVQDNDNLMNPAVKAEFIMYMMNLNKAGEIL